MPKTDDYVCPRCLYRTPLKKNMKKHLYELKRPCAQREDIELTNEIREHVLLHKEYHPPKPVPMSDVSAKQVNNYNNSTNITNLISGMEGLEKLTRLLRYKGSEPVDINDFVELQHQDIVKKLESDHYRQPYLLDTENFLLLVDGMAKTSQSMEEINLLYDEILDRINIWCDGEWNSYLIDSGLRRVVEILRTNYLNIYECYLYRKKFVDKNIGPYDLNKVRVKLEEYYKFLYVFDHHPYVYMETVNNILPDYRPNHPDELCDYGMKIYSEIKETISKTEINKTKKTVLDIIKRNHRLNMKRLNENIIELIAVDPEFQQHFSQRRTIEA